jgi:hypothetical protein
VPRSIAANDQTLPRRRKAAAVAQKERGLFMQILFHSPKDAFAGAVAFAAVVAIIVNAVFLQTARHPSPLFGTALPAPKPVVAAPVVQKAATVAAEPVVTASSPLPRPRPVEAEARAGDTLGNLVRSTSGSAAPTTTASTPRPPATVPMAPVPKVDRVPAPGASSARVAAVQRALTDYGYGQIKVTGTVGADTQAAIQRFERERNLPLTGQMSERLVKELGLATGRSFDQ